MGEFHFLYSLTSLLIRVYKWLELIFIQTFSSKIERKIRGAYRKLDVKFFGSGVTQILTPSNNNKAPSSEDQNGNGMEKEPTNQKKIQRKKLNVEVYNKMFFSRVANHASMGMGETYMDGWWNCEDLEELSYRIFKSGIFLEYLNPWNRFLNYAELSFFNLQTRERAWEVGKKHYDTGNDLFESFLDPWMNYSCGYWSSGAKNLEEAQLNKMELIANKLKLKPGMRVLDIGCGWGGLCKYLAERHGVSCVGITVSAEGVKYAKEKTKGLPVEFRLVDYRDLDETFDRVVSVGMFEHVGRSNYRTFFEVCHRCLNEDGILLLHTIGNNNQEMPGIEPFFHTYIFPNGYLPYYQDITKFTEGLYTLEDWHNFGADYSKTLVAWNNNFKKNWHTISGRYGERFFRMWTYYLQFSSGSFRSRKVQLWQVVLSKNGVEGGYFSVRQ